MMDVERTIAPAEALFPVNDPKRRSRNWNRAVQLLGFLLVCVLTSLGGWAGHRYLSSQFPSSPLKIS